ncbi:MAG: CzcA family heavy metal efflux pump [Caulobacteraceae bacterium]|nr:CzcA family heavy metal efflux pump [Caulobacteraceae bacterium]
MLNRLIDLSLAQRWLVLLAFAGLAAAGIGVAQSLPIDAFPDVSPTQVKMVFKAPGMTPEEVESQVVAPLEQELLGIPKQAILRTTSKYAIADLTLDFQEGTDLYWARQQVAERLNQARDVISPQVTGGLAPISTPLSDVLMFTVEGGDLSLTERRSIVDWVIRPAIRELPGVADLNALGGLVKAYQVVPDPDALARSGLTTADLRTAIMAANRNDGAGRLEESEQALIVRSAGAIQTLGDLSDIVIPLKDGRQTRLGDLAQVRFDALTRYGAVSKNGQGEVAEGIVLSLKGADANAVVRAAQQKFAELQPSLPKGVHIKVFYNRAQLITRAVRTVVEALFEAVLFVVLLLVVFLGNLRASLVVALSLPLAALLTILVMRETNISANLMSLGGLAIAIGMLVDGAVVIVENAAERLATDGGRRSRSEVVAEAAKEVATPVFAGVLIICLVFTPLLALQGQEGKMFSPVALIIVFALAGSLLLSLTFTPSLASLLLARNEGGQEQRPAWIMRQITPLYRRLLEAGLARPRIVVGVAAASMALALAGYFAVGKSFIPTMDEGTIVMQLTKQSSIDLARSLALDTAIQKALLADVPEIQDVVSRTGSDQLGLDPMGLNETDTFITLKPKNTWRRKDIGFVEDQLRKVMARFPGTAPSYTQPIEMRTDEMLTGARGAVVIKIFGTDIARLSQLAVQVRDVVGGVDGASEPVTTAADTLSYLELNTVRPAVGRYGLSVTALQDEMRAALEGQDAGLVREADRRTPILIRGPDALQQHPETFAQTAIATADGGSAHIEDMATVSRRDGPVMVQRENAERAATVQVNVQNRALVAFVKDAQRAVRLEVKLPPGYRVTWGGQFESQQRAAARLSLAIPVALLLIFVVLYLTVRSVRQTLLVLANIPFALVGGMLGLWASGQYLSVPASVGFIALLGIAVLNGLVLVSHYNDLLKEGVPLARVVVEGAERRLRPVLMTASITALGLTPLLFASGPGAEIQRPLATVVVGGLVSSTLLTLVMLPMLFSRFGVAKPEEAPQ